MKNRRYELFDFYRGIAVLFILFIHIGATYPPSLDRGFGNISAPLFANLGSGMQLFFVISGIVLYASFDFSKKNFLLKRIIRIAPLYFVFIFLTVCTFFLIRSFDISFSGFRNSMSSESLSIKIFLLHIFFLQGLFKEGHLFTLLDGSWSLVTEVYYYILFVVCFYWILKKNIIWQFFLLFFTLTLSFVYLEFWSNVLYPDSGSFNYYFFLNNVPCFLSGAILYKLMVEKGYSSKFLRIKFFMIFLPFFASISFFNYFYNAVPLKSIIYICFFGLIFIFLLYLSFVSKKHIYIFLLGVFLLISLAYVRDIFGFNFLLGFAWCLIIFGTYKFSFLQKSKMVKIITQIGVQSYSYYLLHIFLMWPSTYLLLKIPILRDKFILFYLFNFIILFSLTYSISPFFHKLDMFLQKKIKIYAIRDK